MACRTFRFPVVVSHLINTDNALELVHRQGAACLGLPNYCEGPMADLKGVSVPKAAAGSTHRSLSRHIVPLDSLTLGEKAHVIPPVHVGAV